MATNNSGNIYSQALGGADLSRGLQHVMADLATQISDLTANAGANSGAAAVSQIEQLRTVNQSQADAITENTRALLANTASQPASGAGSALRTAGSIASQVLGNGLGLAPLISGLASLFGGRDASTPAPLVSYQRPNTLSFEGQVSRTTNSVDWTATQGSRSGTPAAAPAQQITVQVNAMDSRSFLDHSHEIARAVREAMLNSHSLNDVVNDL